MINQCKNSRYAGTLFLTIMSFSVLLLSSCSPLYLVNTVSTESDAITVSHQSYGNDKRQQLDIYMPASVVAGSPVVVFFYGGSWKNGEKENYAFVGHRMSSKGFVTVIPDYRLYPDVTFPAFVEDGAKVLAWVSESVEQARNGVVVMGHSAALIPRPCLPWTRAISMQPDNPPA